MMEHLEKWAKQSPGDKVRLDFQTIVMVVLMTFADHNHIAVDRMSQTRLWLPCGEESTPCEVRIFWWFRTCLSELMLSFGLGTKGRWVAVKGIRLSERLWWAILHRLCLCPWNAEVLGWIWQGLIVSLPCFLLRFVLTPHRRHLTGSWLERSNRKPGVRSSSPSRSTERCLRAQVGHCQYCRGSCSCSPGAQGRANYTSRLCSVNTWHQRNLADGSLGEGSGKKIGSKYSPWVLDTLLMSTSIAGMSVRELANCTWRVALSCTFAHAWLVFGLDHRGNLLWWDA